MKEDVREKELEKRHTHGLICMYVWQKHQRQRESDRDWKGQRDQIQYKTIY